MKNKTRRLAAFLLSAAVVITAVPGMQERVYAQKTGGYTESPKSENVPVVQETKSRHTHGQSFTKTSWSCDQSNTVPTIPPFLYKIRFINIKIMILD